MTVSNGVTNGSSTLSENYDIPSKNDAFVMVELGKLVEEDRPVPKEPGEYE